MLIASVGILMLGASVAGEEAESHPKRGDRFENCWAKTAHGIVSLCLCISFNLFVHNHVFRQNTLENPHW